MVSCCLVGWWWLVVATLPGNQVAKSHATSWIHAQHVAVSPGLGCSFWHWWAHTPEAPIKNFLYWLGGLFVLPHWKLTRVPCNINELKFFHMPYLSHVPFTLQPIACYSCTPQPGLCSRHAKELVEVVLLEPMAEDVWPQVLRWSRWSRSRSRFLEVLR